jgi:hypothetical protein
MRPKKVILLYCGSEFQLQIAEFVLGLQYNVIPSADSGRFAINNATTERPIDLYLLWGSAHDQTAHILDMCARGLIKLREDTPILAIDPHCRIDDCSVVRVNSDNMAEVLQRVKQALQRKRGPKKGPPSNAFPTKAQIGARL